MIVGCPVGVPQRELLEPHDRDTAPGQPVRRRRADGPQTHHADRDGVVLTAHWCTMVPCGTLLEAATMAHL